MIHFWKTFEIFEKRNNQFDVENRSSTLVMVMALFLNQNYLNRSPVNFLLHHMKLQKN